MLKILILNKMRGVKFMYINIIDISKLELTKDILASVNFKLILATFLGQKFSVLKIN